MVGLVCGVCVVMGWGGGWFCVSYVWVLGFQAISIGVGDARQRYMGWIWAIRASGLYMASGPVV